MVKYGQYNILCIIYYSIYYILYSILYLILYIIYYILYIVLNIYQDNLPGKESLPLVYN